MRSIVVMLVLLCILLHVIVCEIRFAFSFWREGARAPELVLNENNVDILGESWNSPGELSPSGMRMHYLLGRRNRENWANLISDTFKPNEIFVRSTGFNSTISSAISHLQGLYPAFSGPTLTDVQIEKAVPPTSTFDDLITTINSAGTDALPNRINVPPVHIIDNNNDNFFFYNPFYCPPIKEIFSTNASSDRIIQLVTEINTTWGNKLKTALKKNDAKHVFDLQEIYYIADAFVSDYYEKKELKSFVDAAINLDEFLNVANDILFHFAFYYFNGDQEQMFAKISMTPILIDVFRWMDTRIQFDRASKEYTGYVAPAVVLYSTHDNTLASAQTIFDYVFDVNGDYIKTPFASSFVWELYRKDNAVASSLTEADYTLKIFYNYQEYLEISYPVFKSKIRPYLLTVEEINAFCGFDSPIKPRVIPTSYIDATIVLSVLLFLSVVSIVILMILLIKRSCLKTNLHSTGAQPL